MKRMNVKRLVMIIILMVLVPCFIVYAETHEDDNDHTWGPDQPESCYDCYNHTGTGVSWLEEEYRNCTLSVPSVTSGTSAIFCVSGTPNCCGSHYAQVYVSSLWSAVSNAKAAYGFSGSEQITCAYRCPVGNSLAGGVSSSSHVWGKAIDIYIPTHYDTWLADANNYFSYVASTGSAGTALHCNI